MFVGYLLVGFLFTRFPIQMDMYCRISVGRLSIHSFSYSEGHVLSDICWSEDGLFSELPRRLHWLYDSRVLFEEQREISGRGKTKFDERNGQNVLRVSSASFAFGGGQSLHD